MIEESNILESILRFGRRVIPRPIFNFFQPFYHFLWAGLAAFFYGLPSKKLTVIGITGTKGKSTVTEIVSSIFEEAGQKTCLLNSLRFKIGTQSWQNKLKMTMPGRGKIQKFLAQAVRAGCQYAILEVTSEGIKQSRHKFIDFDVAVFLNLAPEHIESHGSFEKYREAKGKLFAASQKLHILNLDDENVNYFLKFGADKKIGFLAKSSTQNKIGVPEVFKISGIEELENGFNFEINKQQFHSPLIGEFNLSNILAAVAVARSQNIDWEVIKRAIKKFRGLPGRMQFIDEGQPFKVVIDYAHTPNSLIKVYEAVRKSEIPNSKFICVLGAAGGGRDKWKRSELGKIAARHCDKIILTNEDPYDEPPEEIIRQVAEGAELLAMDSRNQIRDGFAKLDKILDRREAIRKALTLAKPNDIVVITGKGSEAWICVENNKKIPWSEEKVVREELQKLMRDKY